ncbi:tetratricopeptide repeat protein [Actinocrispum wychmicini]|uniref:Tetratricopeptide repeat protein n=1 Tax=Actinocrispum wychmicini TaxID=1213861 RepID=A0A4V2S6E8_9PSEU|nr:tetratricopeptide repeat protein [Actinocrispum wychmicini]
MADPEGRAGTPHSLGYAHHRLRHHTEAIHYYQQSLALSRELGDQYNEATTLDRLGDTFHSADNHVDAHELWRRTGTILEDLACPAPRPV